jgi:hypothetical protein
MEDCDGVDQDCDGEIDEGFTMVWYHDRDDDGWGSLVEPPMLGCEPDPREVGPISGWPGDCDDDDPSVNYDAVERCDGVDNNCDGDIDEHPVNGSRWYVDGDGDGVGSGYGDYGCGGPGMVLEAGDCDDDDPQRHPGAAERCDGLDQDCDEYIDEGCPPTETTGVAPVPRPAPSAPARHGGCQSAPGGAWAWFVSLLGLSRARRRDAPASP